MLFCRIKQQLLNFPRILYCQNRLSIRIFQLNPVYANLKTGFDLRFPIVPYRFEQLNIRLIDIVNIHPFFSTQ